MCDKFVIGGDTFHKDSGYVPKFKPGDRVEENTANFGTSKRKGTVIGQFELQGGGSRWTTDFFTAVRWDQGGRGTWYTNDLHLFTEFKVGDEVLVDGQVDTKKVAELDGDFVGFDPVGGFGKGGRWYHRTAQVKPIDTYTRIANQTGVNRQTVKKIAHALGYSG